MKLEVDKDSIIELYSFILLGILCDCETNKPFVSSDVSVTFKIDPKLFNKPQCFPAKNIFFKIKSYFPTNFINEFVQGCKSEIKMTEKGNIFEEKDGFYRWSC